MKLQGFFITIIFLAACFKAIGCTSAIIGCAASATGRPMLWKNRDTSAVDNKVEYIAGKDGKYSYVALFNASDRNCEEAWIGMNEMGFAIMNTASYNLKDDKVPQSDMDKEGYLMSQALSCCRTVDDFQSFLDNYPKPMGVEANFGVIDAEGNGAFFETDNYKYTKFDLADAPDGILIRTNFSISGRKNEGYGQIRYANAEHLLAPYAANGTITAELLTEDVSRSFYHDIYATDFATAGKRWVVDQDFIPRYKTTASVVIEGIEPVKDVTELTADDIAPHYIMWTAMGYPPCAETFPVWCSPDGVDPVLRGLADNGHSQQCDKVKARRNDVFHIRDGNRDKYIDMHKLVNPSGTGYLPTLRKQNLEMYKAIRKSQH